MVVRSTQMTTMNSPSSSFSQACNLLSQYLKEKNRSSSYTATTDLLASPLPIPNPNPNPNLRIIESDSLRGGTTMNLFPQQSGFGTTNSVSPSSAPSIMTIFYGGKVMVFDNLTPEKVQQIISLASSSPAGNNRASSGGDALMRSAVDLPIARKGSLQRFFEKRKDRVAARAAPYEVKKTSEGKEKGTTASSWLGLSPQAAALKAEI